MSITEFASHILNEVTFGQIANKQRSVTRLYNPDKFAQRIRDISANGGIRLKEKKPGVWRFSVASGTTPGADYDVYVAFKNIVDVINKAVRDRSIWLEDGSRVNYKLLAAEVLNRVDMEEDCDCMADTFSGSEYIRTQRKAKFGNPENRPPKRNNPKEYGAMCKHGQSVWKVLPAYTSDFAGYLRDFYSKEIKAAEAMSNKEVGAVKKAAGALAKKEKEQANTYTRGKSQIEQEPEVEEPKEEEQE